MKYLMVGGVPQRYRFRTINRTTYSESFTALDEKMSGNATALNLHAMRAITKNQLYKISKLNLKNEADHEFKDFIFKKTRTKMLQGKLEMESHSEIGSMGKFRVIILFAK